MKIPSISRIVTAARALWAREPVVVGTVLPTLVALGVLTAGQVDLITHTVSSVAAAVSGVAAVVGALRARAVVTSPATKQAAAAVASSKSPTTGA